MAAVSSGNNVYSSRYIMQRSTDGGASWNMIPGFGSSWLDCFAASGNYVFASLSMTSLYRSTNSGDNWAVTTLPNLHINAVTINGNTVYAAMGNSGIYISNDNGASWNLSSLNNQTVNSAAASASNVFAGANSTGVWISTNNGTSWVQKNEGLSNLNVTAMFIHGDFVYAGTNGAGVWKRNLNELVAVHNISTEVPNQYNLYQNYPNPFNPVTKIRFQIPKQGNAKLTVFDAFGKEVRMLVNMELKAGTYEADFEGIGLASGIYFYALKTADYFETRKMILVK
jgi:hypothetical protein